MTDADLIEKVTEIVKNAAGAPHASYNPGESLIQINKLLLIHAQSKAAPTPSVAPTQRVRLAVAANSKREWYGCGTDAETPKSSARHAEKSLSFSDGLIRITYVDADILLPVEQTDTVVEGTVVDTPNEKEIS